MINLQNRDMFASTPKAGGLYSICFEYFIESFFLYSGVILLLLDVLNGFCTQTIVRPRIWVTLSFVPRVSAFRGTESSGRSRSLSIAEPKLKVVSARLAYSCFPFGFHPLQHKSCLSVTTGVTRSFSASITESMSLYAAGVSSTTSASLRHSTPLVAAS